MRTVAASLMMGALATASAMGGTVMFDPVEDQVQQGIRTTLAFDVTVGATDLEAFNALMMVFEAEDTLDVHGVVFSWEFEGATAFTPFTALVPEGLSAGGFLSEPVSAINIGALIVTIPSTTPVGDYLVYVDPDHPLNELTLGFEAEPLAGETTIHVVPEPATAALMAFGLLGLVRRQR